MISSKYIVGVWPVRAGIIIARRNVQNGRLEFFVRAIGVRAEQHQTIDLILP
jgi:hypothetical protein